MEQSLSMQMSQKLTMSVQMQQAIKILQLSANELHDVVEEEFLENPALEYEEGGSRDNRYTFDDIQAMRRFLQTDNGGSTQSFSSGDDEKPSFEALAELKPSLENVLEAQVNLAFSVGRKRDIARYIIGLIDEHGYMRGTVEEISRSCTASVDEVSDVLKIVQGFEPDGVGARNLPECLEIQCRQRGIYDGIVRAVIENYLELVGSGKFKKIAELTGVSPQEVQEAVDLIRTLNPKPGLMYASTDAEYVTPDIVIREIDGKFIVVVNDYGVPRLNITNLCDGTDDIDKDTRKYIEGKVNAAVWLLKNIEQRRQTLRNVAEEIVRLQQEYFRHGGTNLRPMLMKEVADNIGVHESTVSRAVANKYAATPFGIKSLKSFFSANIGASSGEELIAIQVKTRIKQLIDNEDSKKPLSDQQITDILQKEDMNISRRTVMKYREQLGIVSSMKRKRY